MTVACIINDKSTKSLIIPILIRICQRKKNTNRETRHSLPKKQRKRECRAFAAAFSKVIKSGEGDRTPSPRSVVTCHYKGSLISGKVFDNSFTRKCPEAFRVNELISGFQIALVNMHEGDCWEVYIPSNMGYGERGAGRDIPGNSSLIFEIQLIKIQ